MRRRKLYWWLTLLAGCLLAVLGLKLSTWKDSQTVAYNLGLEAYNSGDFELANSYFDQSIISYEQAQERNRLTSLVLPAPNRQLAADAFFQKGKCLLRAKRGKEAAGAFKNALRMSPYRANTHNLSARSDPDSTVSDALEHDRVTQYDLELLFRSNQQVAQQQGKGSPKDNKSDKQLPGTIPGAMPGKGKGNNAL